MSQNLNAAVLAKLRVTGHSQGILLWMAALITSGFIGCGSSEAPPPPLGLVKGKVTINGMPAQGVTVTFQPQGKEGGISVGTTNAQGEYELVYTGNTTGPKGAAVGEHVVRISSVATDAPDAEGKILPYVFIPEKYNAVSDLKASVVAGDNPPKNFELLVPKQ